MNAIKFITALLVKAYEAEHDRLRKHAAKLGKKQAKVSLEAQELAKKATAAVDEANELGREKYHTNDRAAALLVRRDEVSAFFLGEK